MKDRLYRWLALHLPKRLVMWCAVRVIKDYQMKPLTLLGQHEAKNALDLIREWYGNTSEQL